MRRQHGKRCGQSLVEYGLLCVLIALAAMAGLSALSQSVNATHSKYNTSVQKAIGPTP